MSWIALRIFNIAFACSLAAVWALVCYNYGQFRGVVGGGVVGDGDFGRGDWPVDLCDCC